MRVRPTITSKSRRISQKEEEKKSKEEKSHFSKLAAFNVFVFAR